MISIQSPQVVAQSSCKMDYSWTHKVACTPPLIIHVITLAVPLALVALVETIVEVTKMILRYFGFIQTESKPTFEAKSLFSQFKELGWKKTLLWSGVSIGAMLTAAVAYRTFYPNILSAPSETPIGTSIADYLNKELGLGLMGLGFLGALSGMHKKQDILTWACKNNHYYVANCMLKLGAKIDVCNSEGQSPFEIVLNRNYNNLIELLLESESYNEYTWTSYLNSLLHKAFEKGNHQILEFLCENGADVNSVDANGNTLLHKASLEKKIELIKNLANLLADPNIKNKTGATPLHLVWHDQNLAQILLEQGADVDACDENGETPFLKACISNDFPMIQFYQKKGANINVQGKNGLSALHCACLKENVVLIEFLLKSGINVDARETSQNRTALHLFYYVLSVSANKIRSKIVSKNVNSRALVPIAEEVSTQITFPSINKSLATTSLEQVADENTRQLIFLHKKKIEIFKLLLNYGADIDAYDKKGNTVLLDACKDRDLDAVMFFLDNKASPNRGNQFDGNLPLHIAAENSGHEIARSLLGHGADLMNVNKEGLSPLHISVLRNDLEMVKLLVEFGMPIEDDTTITDLSTNIEDEPTLQKAYLIQLINQKMKNESEDTPFYLACKNKNFAIMIFLLRKGAKIGETLLKAISKNEREMVCFLYGILKQCDINLHMTIEQQKMLESFIEKPKVLSIENSDSNNNSSSNDPTLRQEAIELGTNFVNQLSSKELEAFIKQLKALENKPLSEPIPLRSNLSRSYSSRPYSSRSLSLQGSQKNILNTLLKQRSSFVKDFIEKGANHFSQTASAPLERSSSSTYVGGHKSPTTSQTVSDLLSIQSKLEQLKHARTSTNERSSQTTSIQEEFEELESSTSSDLPIDVNNTTTATTSTTITNE